MYRGIQSVLAIAAGGLLLSIFLFAQDTHFEPQGGQIPGPSKLGDSSAHAEWLADLKRWRAEHKIRIGFRDDEYRRPELQWTQRNFVSPQVMVEDRYLFDPERGQYTVGRYLDDLETRYGGIDSVLLWPVYPNIGIDNRNQWDLTRDLPGGREGVRKMIEEFHSRSVKVLFPAMPWDVGTRDPGMEHATATAQLMADLGADGVNGDTFSGIPHSYRQASDATKHIVALEPELMPSSDEGLLWNTMSWAYWKFPFTPMVSKAKWLESRHMQHVCDRWARDKTDNLQYAFFNGLGYVSWENVWGIWNGITPRDGEALRRIATVERVFADLLASPDWEPFTPTEQAGVFSSRFPGKDATLWTVVNRNEYAVDGPQLEVSGDQLTYFDLWNGRELKPLVQDGHQRLNFPLEAHGFGAVLAAKATSTRPDLQKLLSQMNVLSQKPLASFSHQWEPLPQQIVSIDKTRGVRQRGEMIRIPTGKFQFHVSGVEIEGDNWAGLDVQYPWESIGRRTHDHEMDIQSFLIDKYPVTNQEFKRFLDAARYKPADSHNFLRDWDNGAYPAGWERRPVTWISLEDARAYAAWAGKRLPHEWEWQYAAQGSDGRFYPWGNQLDATAMPAQSHARELTGPASVDAHPKGASPFGVEDMMGNVWQWTDEYRDEHTRAAILRGGSYYRPEGSRWYFPRNETLGEHGKYLLMAPSKDRSGTVGFRCVADE